MNLNDGKVIESYKARQMPDEYKPFVVDYIPEPIRTYIIEGAKTLVCDPAYIALPMLSALASAIGNSRRIKLKEAWHEPAIIWSAIVGESGSMKSPAIDLAMRPLRKMQNEAFREYAEAMEEYEKLEAEYQQALREKKKGYDLPDKPVEPIATRYYCSDVTVEALAGLLSKSPRGLLLARDELSGWVRSFNSYKSGKGGDEAKWLELHRAGTLLVDRKSGTPRIVHIPDASVSILGGIQPSILSQVLGTEHFENGLAARLLLAMPPRRAKQWTEADIDSTLEERVENIFKWLLELEMFDDFDEGLKPRVLSLTPEAQKMWIEFYNDHAKEQAEIAGGEMSAAMSKLEAYAARLALVIHCVRSVTFECTLESKDCIDERSIAAGVMIANWFKSEIKRVYSVMREGEMQKEQRQLLEMVRRKGGKLTVRALQRSSRAYQGDPDTAENALQELVNIGWGKWEYAQPGSTGGRPSKVFVIESDSGDDKTLDHVA